jgi:AcrR family transcriptional regulator
MTLSLRERRRQQTARDIQIATLDLAVQKGLENVTTEEIAAAVGISTRTFFNYYTNKETAAVGAPPAFTEAAKEALRDGSGPLADDLKLFLDQHVAALTKDEPILKMIGTVLRSNEKARGILQGFLIMERRELTECLSHRVQNPQAAAALASNTTDAVGRAIILWEHEENLSLSAALDVVWEGTIAAAALLTSTS